MLFGLVRMWLTGLLGVALWVGVFFLAREWYRQLPDPRPVVEQRVNDAAAPQPLPPAPEPTFEERLAAWRPGVDQTTGLLAAALALTLLGFGGGRGLLWLVLLPKGTDGPRHERLGQVRVIRRADGTELHVEVAGRADGPTVVLTHGWGANSTEWYYLRHRLGDRYRLVAWDLPGLGRSKSPGDKNFNLDKMAGDLRAVLDEVGGGPFVLLGHSIGGMITLTYAKLYPAELGTRVIGLVLVHTTPTNPLRTMPMGSLYTAIQKPVLEPLCYLTIAAAPVVWLSNALGYLNGSQHLSNFKTVFSYSATWGQLEFVTRYVLQVCPAVYARGLLGMFRYHAADALAGIVVPTLVVAGDRDKVTKPEASEAIRAGVPGAELTTLSPGGHMGLISKHEEFGAAVEGFLGRCFRAHTSAPRSRAMGARTSG